MRELCLHSQCVCVCVTGFLVQHCIVHWFQYFNTRTKIFRSVTIFFRTFAKKFWSVFENFGPSCPYRVDEKTKAEFLKIQMHTNRETSDDEILVEKFQFLSVLETYLSERKVFALAVCVCVCVSLDFWCSIVLYTGSNISILTPKFLGP